MATSDKKTHTSSKHRYLSHLREEFANTLFANILKKYPSSLTIKTSKGVWNVSFSYDHEKVKAQGKTLAHALINLVTKSPLLSSGCFTPKTTAL